jgi:phage-related protein
MQELLNQMNTEQRAKVHRALDDTRNEANLWVDSIANPILGTVDNLADGIIRQADSFANSLDNLTNNIPVGGWRDDAKRFIREGKDAVKGAVNSARSWLKGQLTSIQNGVKSAIWHFIETLKNAYRTGAEINGIVEDAAQNLKNQIDNAVRGANDLVAQFKGKVLSAAGWTRNLGVNIGWPVNINFNIYDKLVQPAVNAVADGFQSAIGGIGSKLQGAVDWVKPRAQKAIAAVVDALFGDKTAHLWNKIHKVDEQIAATQTEVERKIVNKAKELQGQLNDFLNKLGSDGKKLLDTLLNFSNSPTAQIGMGCSRGTFGINSRCWSSY